MTNCKMYTVNYGESVTLHCTIEGCTETTDLIFLHSVWKRRILVTGETNKITGSIPEWNDRTHKWITFLTFESASSSNSGIYNYSLYGLNSADIELHVIRSK